jgi:hypothetical protein
LRRVQVATIATPEPPAERENQNRHRRKGQPKPGCKLANGSSISTPLSASNSGHQRRDGENAGATTTPAHHHAGPLHRHPNPANKP